MYAKKPIRSYETNQLLIFVIIFISIFPMIHPLSADETIPPSSSPGITFQWDTHKHCAVVTDVEPDKNIFKAGLRAGDGIYKINAKMLNTEADFRKVMAILKPGKTAKLHVTRNGKKMTFNFTVEMKQESEASLIKSLCATDEKSLFSCKLKNSSKSVSLCQSESDPKEISYKFGAPNKIEISLPNEKSGKPYLSYLSGGRGGAHSIVFPSGKVNKHALVFMWELDEKKPIFLSVEEMKKPLNMSCDSGDSSDVFMNALDKMEKLNFKIEEVTP